ncbi:alpha/beta fold hydrolase [Rhodovibrio sodomensis]|uniref:alpha/beta fold hydrolase n=1 Tax=Rhodovibrio sodomensis TaxID=1088 RepID=UPI001906784E
MLLKLLLAGLVGYALLVGLLYTQQRQILFKPDRGTPERPADAPDGFAEITSQTADGLSLSHWYLPPARAGAGVVVVLHGNAGSRDGSYRKFQEIHAWGYGLVLADYRGYAGNPGAPSEAGLIADARSVLDWLAGQGVPAGRAVLYGESLGSGVATALAAEREVAGMVLEAPFTSVADLAQQQYWYVPAKWLVRDPFDSRARIPSVSAPSLILHGDRDPTIPVDHGIALAEAAGGRAELARFPEGDHLNLWRVGADARVRAFLQRVLG